MQALRAIRVRAIRVRVVLLAIVAMLLHASSPALHVHARHVGGSEWTEVCAGSGRTMHVRVDPSTGESLTATAGAAVTLAAADRSSEQAADDQ